MNTKIVFITTEFEASHGHRPRGDGLWGFSLSRRAKDIFWVSGPYTKAKQRARTHFMSLVGGRAGSETLIWIRWRRAKGEDHEQSKEAP